MLDTTITASTPITLRVDGHPHRTTLGLFLADNSADDGIVLADLTAALARGEAYRGGGGAAPEWSVERGAGVVSGEQHKAAALSEPELPDSYPIYGDYWYVADGKPVRSNWHGITAGDFKRREGVKVLCRCDLPGRDAANLYPFAKAQP